MCSSCRLNCDSAACRQRAGAPPSWSAEDLNPCHPGQGWGTSPPQICTCRSQMVTWRAFYCHFLWQKFNKPVCLFICRRCINSFDRLSCPVEFRHLLKNTHHIQSVHTCSCGPICLCVFYLHSSLHYGRWEACQCSDVSSMAWLADTFLQLVQEYQLITIYCCL